MSKELENEWIVPKSPESDFKVRFPLAKTRWSLFEEARYLEVHSLDLTAALMNFGSDMLSMPLEERMVLRSRKGDEISLNFMDRKFSPAIRHSDISFDNSKISEPEKRENETDKVFLLTFASKHRDLYFKTANFHHIDVEELSVRLVNVGLYALKQRRSRGYELHKYQPEFSQVYEFSPANSKQRIMQKIEEWKKSVD